jgi:hypothetical protein
MFTISIPLSAEILAPAAPHAVTPPETIPSAGGQSVNGRVKSSQTRQRGPSVTAGLVSFMVCIRQLVICPLEN